jgi:hypothetical protein
MALDFPSSPTLNQVFTSGGRSWIWNGSQWIGNNAAALVGGTTGQVQVNNGNGFGAVSSGTSGQALVSAGAGVPPSFGTLGVAGGGTGATTLTGVVKGTGTSALTAGSVALGSEVTGTLPVANGGTGVTTSTGTGSTVLSISPELTGAPYVNGSYRGNLVAVAALDIDCSAGNYFTKTINANSTFTFSNAPASRSYAFALELTHTSGTITWPTSVKWPKDTAPTLTTGKTHIFIFVTDDGGTRWRGAALVDYVD